MKKILVFILVAIGTIFASELKWHTDIKVAYEEASEYNQTMHDICREHLVL